jgi:hypothetical protein
MNPIENPTPYIPPPKDDDMTRAPIKIFPIKKTEILEVDKFFYGLVRTDEFTEDNMQKNYHGHATATDGIRRSEINYISKYDLKKHIKERHNDPSLIYDSSLRYLIVHQTPAGLSKTSSFNKNMPATYILKREDLMPLDKLYDKIAKKLNKKKRTNKMLLRKKKEKQSKKKEHPTEEEPSTPPITKKKKKIVRENSDDEKPTDDVLDQ